MTVSIHSVISVISIHVYIFTIPFVMVHSTENSGNQSCSFYPYREGSEIKLLYGVLMAMASQISYLLSIMPSIVVMMLL